MKWYYLPLLDRTVLPGCHPVPAPRCLARNGVWQWGRAAEEDTGLYFDITPQFSVVFPADKRVHTSSRQLQQGELQHPFDSLY